MILAFSGSVLNSGAREEGVDDFQVAFVGNGGYLKNQTGHIDRFCMMEAVSQAPHIIEPFVILLGAKAGIEALAAFVPRGNRPFDLHAVVLLGFLF